MQAKDIPTRSVLESIKNHAGEASIYILWTDDFPDVPFKVFRAKMDKLGNQGLVDCCCNECSSWIGLKRKGDAMIEPPDHPSHYSDSRQEK